MGSLLALLAIVFVSLLVVRIGTNALVLTGMSLTASRFQAASAFFGVGFTTSEAEMVVGHEVRRRIILHLIIAGNIGLTSALATLIVTFVSQGGEGAYQLFSVMGLLLVGVIVLYILANTGFLRKPMDAVMRYSLERAGVVRALDYELLLNVEHGFCVSDFRMEAEHPFVNKALHESRPNDQGIVILGVTKRGGGFIGTPSKDVVLEAGDTVMVYGSEESVDKMAHLAQ
ncbi:MAG: TrkA C-terminal domain-containing protein [Verrucomicrobiae bacterium]|nr:TrkA C-terminal domain-containing protein [Verrucomicrobiae bacterium]NNJ44208.1 TrkA C-terminal domain-containing protein [Akkermansiaceae bacterium]